MYDNPDTDICRYNLALRNLPQHFLPTFEFLDAVSTVSSPYPSYFVLGVDKTIDDNIKTI